MKLYILCSLFVVMLMANIGCSHHTRSIPANVLFYGLNMANDPVGTLAACSVAVVGTIAAIETKKAVSRKESDVHENKQMVVDLEKGGNQE